MSPDFNGTYTPHLVLSPSGGVVEETIIYVRLKSGLAVGVYHDEVAISSPGVLTKYVTLSGVVENVTGIGDLPGGSSAAIVSTEYYTLTGQRLYNKPKISGIYIVKKYMSDNTVNVLKIWIK